MKTISGIEFASEHNGTDVFRLIELAYEQGQKDGHSEQLSTNLAEVSTDCISRQQAIDALERVKTATSENGERWIAKINAQMELEQLPPAQPYTIHSDGRLWVTVDDIDKVTAVVVDEHKSKFCKQFYEDAQPEITYCKDCKHHWTHKCMDSFPIERCDLEQTFYDAEHDFCSLAERREVNNESN